MPADDPTAGSAGASAPRPENAAAAHNPEVLAALFVSDDPHLHANKQATYHIVRSLIEAGHWELADRYLTERYIQHDPNAASGRAAVIDYFTHVRKVRPTPIDGPLTTRVFSVVAEGSLVTLGYYYTVADPRNPAESYTAAAFDMWRFKDGRADEHWDSHRRP